MSGGLNRSSASVGPACDVFEILAILLLVVWLLGVLSLYTFGGAIHGCLVLAAVAATVHYRKSHLRR